MIEICKEAKVGHNLLIHTSSVKLGLPRNCSKNDTRLTKEMLISDREDANWKEVDNKSCLLRFVARRLSKTQAKVGARDFQLLKFPPFHHPPPEHPSSPAPHLRRWTLGKELLSRGIPTL